MKYDLRDLQLVELGILKKFKEVSDHKKLTWFAMFGTLLGAIRHGGFIPWDDDMDIALPRVDYDKLRRNTDWFLEPYFLQTPHNDPAAQPNFLRLMRLDTTNIPSHFPNDMTRGGHMGVYIDIFPLDSVPNGEIANLMQGAVCSMQDQMHGSAALDESADCDVPMEKSARCYMLGGAVGRYGELADRYESFCATYANDANAPYYFIPVCGNERGCRVYEKSWFEKSELRRFEDMEIPVPIGYREIIVAAYPDGALLPEPKFRRPKDAFGESNQKIVDLARSYKHYTKKYTDMLTDIGEKNVYLFGAGDSLRIWLERYGKGLNIVCAFDNSESKWGAKAFGVEIHSPEQLPDFVKRDGEKARIIIASLYHKEISKQLERMGIEGYYIFVDGLKYEK
jgi:lipopolysaccharide cholinephosphotransferase